MVISLNLPLIYEEAKKENKDFFEKLRYYLDLIRDIHRRTKDYLSKLRASCNPIGFICGGYFYGNLKPEDTIKKNLDIATYSFGITALNELQELYNGKYLSDDSDFAFKTEQYINDYINQAKKEDHILYSLYATPAEELAYKQAKQFINKFGEIKVENEEIIGGRGYFSNSFHCAVWNYITFDTKAKTEYRMFHNCNGGHIFYYRLTSDKNLAYIDQCIKKAMKEGFYYGVNLARNFCPKDGFSWVDDKIDCCPLCNNSEIYTVSRLCGYLGYTRMPSSSGDSSRINDGKLKEIAERRVM